MQNITICVISLIVLLVAGCASAPEQKPVSAEEQVQQEQNLGADLARELEPQLKFKQDGQVQKYLGRLAGKLSGEKTPVSVKVVIDHDKKWRNFGLPHSRIYLSANMLKSIEFENELAAAIALELAHLSKRHVVSRLPQLPHPPKTESKANFFGADGLFDFTEDEYFDATDEAIGLLYRAGFDPRGLTGLWTKYERKPASSPFEPAQLEKLRERTRDSISRYTPLRNPVVRSSEFVTIQKRISRP